MGTLKRGPIIPLLISARLCRSTGQASSCHTAARTLRNLAHTLTVCFAFSWPCQRDGSASSSAHLGFRHHEDVVLGVEFLCSDLWISFGARSPKPKFGQNVVDVHVLETIRDARTARPRPRAPRVGE